MEEWKLREAVEHIRPDDRLEAKVLGLYGKRPARSSKRGWKAAVSFAAAAAVVCGLLFWPQGTGMAGTASERQTGSPAPAPAHGFTVVARAAEKNGADAELQPGRTFTLETDGDQSARGSGMIDAETGKFKYLSIYQFPLQCVGEAIRSVTYETNRGVFEQGIELTKDQIEDREEQKALIERGFESIFASKRDKTTGQDRHYGFKPFGVSFAQDYGKEGTGSLLIKYSIVSDEPIEPTEQDHFVLSERFASEVEGTRIKITAQFEDGSSASKTVELSTGNRGLRICATLLG